MLTWKSLTTVWKYGTTFPKDQTSATLDNGFRHTSAPVGLPLGRQLGSRVLCCKKISELAILVFANLRGTNLKHVPWVAHSC